MPESRARKKRDFTPQQHKPSGPTTSPTWYAPLMVALLLVGLAYIVVFYVTDGRYPVDALGAWNVVLGFAVIMAGFIMSTRWR